jgi:superfamily I DNA and/or RNA helicase
MGPWLSLLVDFLSFHHAKTKQSSAVHAWIRDHFQYASENFIFLNVDGKEEKSGTSYVNPINARYCVELAAYIARECPSMRIADKDKDQSEARRGKILIITGYRPQKHLINHILSELPEWEVPRGLISCRTIDDSPSHEAEIVIADMTRTVNLGLMKERSRLAVMTTRAILAHFTVGSTRP